MLKVNAQEKNGAMAHWHNDHANISGCTVLGHDHDEADTLIICVKNKAMKQSEKFGVRILSPDTFLCALYFAREYINI